MGSVRVAADRDPPPRALAPVIEVVVTAKGLTPDEATARRVIEKVLGRPVTQWDFNCGASVPDLRIENLDGTFGFAEVVADTSKPWQAMRDVLGKGYDMVPLPGRRYDWYVWPAVTARVKRDLAPHLPDLIRRLEEAGETFGHRRLSPTHLQAEVQASAFSDELNRLGIVEIVAGPLANGVAAAHINLPGTGGNA